MRFSVLLLAIFAGVATTAPAAELQKKTFQLGQWEDDIGYRQAVRVGNALYISGTTGSGPMPQAIKTAYLSLEATLRHFGLTFQHVVKENIYTTDIEALKQHGRVRRNFYGSDFPAATWVQISRLFLPEHVIEVELIAAFPE